MGFRQWLARTILKLNLAIKFPKVEEKEQVSQELVQKIEDSK